MSKLSVAFDELLDAQEEVRGVRVKLRIGGGQLIDALIESDQTSLTQMAGGYADSGNYAAIVRRSDFTTMPEQGIEVTNDGVTQQLLSVTTVNDTYRMEIGSVAAEDQ